MELVRENAIEALVNLVGHAIPTRAKTLYQGSIRALYGRDQLRNVVLCSTSEELAGSQITYFFQAGQIL
jgi:nucleoside diphosphate kinase